MSTKRKMSEWVKNYKELLLFLLFSLFCAFEAAGKGALNEFGNIEFWLMLSAMVANAASVAVVIPLSVMAPATRVLPSLTDFFRLATSVSTACEPTSGAALTQ